MKKLLFKLMLFPALIFADNTSYSVEKLYNLSIPLNVSNTYNDFNIEVNIIKNDEQTGVTNLANIFYYNLDFIEGNLSVPEYLYLEATQEDVSSFPLPPDASTTSGSVYYDSDTNIVLNSISFNQNIMSLNIGNIISEQNFVSETSFSSIATYNISVNFSQSFSDNLSFSLNINNSTSETLQSLFNQNYTTDSDNDGIIDTEDKFINDIAASIDNDMDGKPDSWNSGYSQIDSTTGLVLDDIVNFKSVSENLSLEFTYSNDYTNSLTATDKDGDSLNFEIVKDATNGYLNLSTDGSFEYIPNKNVNGIDSFTFKVFDSKEYSSIYDVNLTIYQDLDLDTIADDIDPILRHPLIDQTNGISVHLGEYTLNLKTGWQMISLPVDTILQPHISDYTFTNEMNEFSNIYVDRYANFKIFGDYEIIWQYIDGDWYAYSEDESTRNSVILSGYGILEQLDSKHSFWIYMNTDRLVTFYGKEYSPPVETYKYFAWSMMSSSYIHTTDEMKALAGIDIIWQYEDGNWTMNPENIKSAAWIRKVNHEDANFKIYMEARHAIGNGDYITAKSKAESITNTNLGKYLLGRIYFCGLGVDKNINTAKSYLEDSIDLVYSKHSLAFILGREGNYELEKQYYDEIITEHNYSITYNNLGALYENGFGVVQNFNTAKSYYEKALAIDDYSLALKNLGDLYKEGKGVDKNISKAAELYMKSSYKNNDLAQDQIGYAYYDGTCVPQDYSQAKKWFEKSAFMGKNDNAYNMLGILYNYGYGVTQDYSQAVSYYTKAHEIDPGDYGTSNLGSMYYHGSSVTQDYYKAVELYQIAADTGNKYGQGNLADMYYYGLGISQNYTLAAEYYTLAAEQGVSWAQDMLGILHFDGNGVSQSYDTAYEWFEKAANNNNADAMTWLGWYYMDGLGNVTKNQTTGFEWYIKAAANGNTWAQNKMAYLYWQGTGTSVNKSKSYCWAQTSCNNGYSDACTSLNNTDWTGVYIPSDCSSYLQDEINTYKIQEEVKEQCTNLNDLYK